MSKTVLAHYPSATMTLVTILVGAACSNPKEPSVQDRATVEVAGEMRQVMQHGNLSASINLDTVEEKQHLYGVGPLDSLKGEITVLDGSAYYSTLIYGEQIVRNNFKISAPFFVYANVKEWDEMQLPDSVTTEIQLDKFLTLINGQRQEPLAFRIKARIDTASVHIVSLPTGTGINAPADTHIGQKDFTLINSDVDIIGFFSKNHKGVFTHHDSNVHMHLITVDRTSTGHVDQLRLRGGTTLYLQN